MDARFNHLESLHWLWLVAGAAVLLMWSVGAGRRALVRFAAAPLLMHLVPGMSGGRRMVKCLLLALALVALVAAMIDPRWGTRFEDVQRRGIDILFVIDVSRSMLAEDVSPNRLDRARQCIADVVDECAGDRVGLISFAGVAAVKCPLTVDYGAFRLSLNELAPESAVRGGSMLGDALRLAGDSFTDEIKDHKAVIVLSDGEDQGSYPVEAAQKLLNEKGVHVFTVGIGDSIDGGRIPVVRNGQRSYLLYEGQEVWSKMNGEVLRDVALNGGGAYVPAGTQRVELADIYRQKIAPAAKRDVESSRIRVDDPQYQWFAGLALGLLLIESWMSLQSPIRRSLNGLQEEPS